MKEIEDKRNKNMKTLAEYESGESRKKRTVEEEGKREEAGKLSATDDQS